MVSGDQHNQADPLDTPCVDWDGPTNNKGYGSWWHRFGPGDSEILAHRTAYRLSGGDIPPGMTIDHLCRNKACLNVAHMEVVTRGENSRRAGGIEACAAKKRAQTHCTHGHPLDESNTYTDKRGRRGCRTCRTAATLRFYYRNKEASNG